MKKKSAANIKRSSSKPKKTEAIAKRGRVFKMSLPAQPKRSLADDPAYSQAVQHYESGLRLMQEKKFDKAKVIFQKVVAGTSRQLADRATVHLNTCNQHLSKPAQQFKSVAEHYDYAVSVMNIGDFINAREHLEKLVKQSPQSDFVWYGYAVLECLTGHSEDAIKRLSEAVRLNPANRFQARNDSDFQNLGDDPRFTELLYPEPSGN